MDVAGCRNDQRIHFEQRAVALVEQSRQVHEQIRELIDLRALQTECERDFATLIRLCTDKRIDRGADDLLGRLFRDLFDLDAAFGRRHEHDATRRAVDHRAEIQFALDVGAALDVDLADRLTVFVGLYRDQTLAQPLLRERFDLRRRVRQLDAAGLAAAAGVHLDFDYPLIAADLLRRIDRGLRRIDRIALRYRQTVFGKQLLCLVFVQIHVCASVTFSFFD